MTYPSQLDEMREVIQTELVPRVVKLLSSQGHGKKHRAAGEFWNCEICQTETDYDPATAHNPLMANHSTFCKLGNILGVIE